MPSTYEVFPVPDLYGRLGSPARPEQGASRFVFSKRTFSTRDDFRAIDLNFILHERKISHIAHCSKLDKLFLLLKESREILTLDLRSGGYETYRMPHDTRREHNANANAVILDRTQEVLAYRYPPFDADADVSRNGLYTIMDGFFINSAGDMCVLAGVNQNKLCGFIEAGYGANVDVKQMLYKSSNLSSPCKFPNYLYVYNAQRGWEKTVLHYLGVHDHRLSMRRDSDPILKNRSLQNVKDLKVPLRLQTFFSRNNNNEFMVSQDTNFSKATWLSLPESGAQAALWLVDHGQQTVYRFETASDPLAHRADWVLSNWRWSVFGINWLCSGRYWLAEDQQFLPLSITEIPPACYYRYTDPLDMGHGLQPKDLYIVGAEQHAGRRFGEVSLQSIALLRSCRNIPAPGFLRCGSPWSPEVDRHLIGWHEKNSFCIWFFKLSDSLHVRVVLRKSPPSALDVLTLQQSTSEGKEWVDVCILPTPHFDPADPGDQYHAYDAMFYRRRIPAPLFFIVAFRGLKTGQLFCYYYQLTKKDTWPNRDTYTTMIRDHSIYVDGLRSTSTRVPGLSVIKSDGHEPFLQGVEIPKNSVFSHVCRHKVLSYYELQSDGYFKFQLCPHCMSPAGDAIVSSSATLPPS
ncbi:MAG: hypothetical protein K5Q00_00135 [Gammaproteobacteria bacterium]|nr:hypothetical protein [Gammaproteobacteria bacterium]